jgi:YesN/AraC family two-component response regulator
LEKFRKNPTDIIITDIVMPEKNGMEAIKELRRDFPDVGIIAISGGAQVGPYSFLMTAQRLGADKVFAKPIDHGELSAAIQELTERSAKPSPGK